MTALEVLENLRPDQRLSTSDVFDAISAAGAEMAGNDRENEVSLDIAIRLLEARRAKQLPEDCEQLVEYLAEECGLYPYLDIERFNLLTQVVIEAHSIELRDKLYLHSKQMQVLLRLLDGDNVILSAPTSFGKTLLVDALIAKKLPEIVVMIQPTIALIDECRRRLSRNFSDRYQIITTATEDYDDTKPVLFVLTQERFLQRRDIARIDLLFVDEFYKLDPDRDDSRYETLNLALYKALPKSRQIFMAGPHIRSITLGDRWSKSFKFVRTDYRTVTVNIIDRSKTEDRLLSFVVDLRSVADESSLVFTATPATAESLMVELISRGFSYATDISRSLGNWISQNYHAEWSVASGANKGILVHHGRLPRSLGQLFVQLFNGGSIGVLICTSTLIEGVNTSAANVFIYDKKINRSDFDFFSFANIRGRVGRMMQHFVGNAFLYHEAPRQVATDVDVPILSDPGHSSEYLLMNVDRRELSQAGVERQRLLPFETGLSDQILREHGAIGVDLLTIVLERVQSVLAEQPSLLVWKGFPDKQQRSALADCALLITQSRRERTGVHTVKQLAWAWNQLRYIKTFPAFLRWFARTFKEAKPGASYLDPAFQFLQACEFAFPRAIAAVEALVRHATGSIVPTYSPYIVAMENWFRPVWMKQLDEAGIPVPLAERLAPYLGEVETRAEALEKIKLLNQMRVPVLDEVDRFIIEKAISLT